MQQSLKLKLQVGNKIHKAQLHWHEHTWHPSSKATHTVNSSLFNTFYFMLCFCFERYALQLWNSVSVAISIHFAVLNSRLCEYAVVVSSSVWDSVKSAAVVVSEVQGAVKHRFAAVATAHVLPSRFAGRQPDWRSELSTGDFAVDCRITTLRVTPDPALPPAQVFFLLFPSPDLHHQLPSRVYTRSPLLIYQIVEFSQPLLPAWHLLLIFFILITWWWLLSE